MASSSSRTRGAALACLACVWATACSLGDPSVYHRGDLGEGGVLGPTGGGPGTSTSSSGGPTDASVPSDSTPVEAGVPCTEFVPPAVNWTWDGADLHYHLDAVDVGSDAGVGVMHYGVIPGTPAHADLSQHHSSGDCTQCISLDLPGDRYFFQRSGIADVVSTNPCAAITATVSELVLEEVTFDGDGSSVPKPGGACFHASAVMTINSTGGCE